MSAPDPPPVRAGRPGWGLAARLVAVFALIIALTGLIAWAVASVVGPESFHRHLVAAGLGEDAAALAHAEAAFRSASATSLGIALGAAAAASLALSILITRRVTVAIGQLSAAAAQVAGGRFDARVAAPRLGAEFDGLAEAFNQMGAGLGASQRLRDRLLGDVAHELRTPVATIAAYVEALEDGVAELTPETAAVLRAQGDRLTRLASDLAAVARAQDPLAALELEPVPAAAVLEAAASAAQPGFAAKGVALRVEANAAGASPIRVDRARFAQVLANLLENALRHTPPGGTVRLTAEAPGGEGRAPAGASEAPVVRLTVADTGEGIEPEHLDHVFERFYRVDQSRDRLHGGSGIGLAIAKALTEAHGGSIAVQSGGAGAGAAFAITLPAARS